MMIAHLPRVPH